MKRKKPIVLFDANPLVGNKSGVGQYTYRLIESMARNSSDSLDIKAYYFNFLGRKKVTDLPHPDVIEYIEIRFFPTKIVNLLHRINLQLPLELFLGPRKFDFIMFTNFVSVPTLRRIPYALAVHDMAFEDHPDYLSDANQRYLHRFVGRSIRNSSAIITISDFTKSRITHYYGKKAASKTIVTPIPFEPADSFGNVNKDFKQRIVKPYILYVGTIEPRKNISNLLLSFAITSQVFRDTYSLVLAGGKGWKTEEIDNTIANTKNKINLIQTGYVSEAERDYLYKNCVAIVNLSHYEGFGMQLFEAMYYKKKILLSDIPVFREIASDYAEYTSETNTSLIAASLERIVTSQIHKTTTPDWSWKKNSDAVTNKIISVLNSQK